jgi:GNAT superfamily N-acetyltransferase
MSQEQVSIKKPTKILVRTFTWQDWETIWNLNTYWLAEQGVIVDGQITPLDFTLPYDERNPNYPEMDIERIDECYLKARGNFWIAWADSEPAGTVGAQDLGDYIELRRMYVRKEYRRLGIGTQLVRALIDHCQNQKASPIKLWTAAGGPGRFLYATLGFQPVKLQGEEFQNRYALNGEIRMMLNPAE